MSKQLLEYEVSVKKALKLICYFHVAVMSKQINYNVFINTQKFVIGDKFENINNATIINKSSIDNAIN